MDNDPKATIFWKIVQGELPAKVVYQDEHVVAFHDINPQAPVHVLVIPRQPVRDLVAAPPEVLLAVMRGVQEVVKLLGLADSGFRVVVNTNSDGGQSVFYLHAHILGGRRMSWPPG